MTVHVFVITLEFTYAPFSGNGILARGLVKSLLEQGCHVTVWCCYPDAGENNHLQPPEISQDHASRLVLYGMPVSKWHRVDDQSSWQEFDWNLWNDTKTIEEALHRSNRILAIDWTGAYAFRSLPQKFRRPLVYLNFRVFSSGIADRERREWFDDMERQALQDAATIVTLSEHDKDALFKLLPSSKGIHVLLPPLRSDIHSLATTTPRTDLLQHLPGPIRERLVERTKFIVCVVRLSPEKDTLRFVQFVKCVLDIMTEQSLVPVLAGSCSDKEYGREVREELLQVAPAQAIILDLFLAPEALCALFSETILNFHPCAYDAYGMTIVEAAAMGVPSVIAAGDKVGAASLLGYDGSLQVTMSGRQELPETSVQVLRQALLDLQRLRKIGAVARERALAHNEQAYGNTLLRISHDISSDYSNS